MNETLAAILLGIVQGLTEFLPVSSSGHLALFQRWLPVSGDDDVGFFLALHIGTLLPVLLVYRDDLMTIVRDAVAGEGPLTRRPGMRLAAFIVLGSVPTGIIGIAFKDWLEAAFQNPLGVGIAFAVTGALLFATRFVKAGETDLRRMKPWHALAVGLAQGIAITPGISRSGSTIAAGMFLGLRRDLAARYSFLLSIPAIGGAFLVKLPDMGASHMSLGPVVAGFIAAALSGYVALKILLRLVASGDFSRFAWYLWALAIFAIGTALAG